VQCEVGNGQTEKYGQTDSSNRGRNVKTCVKCGWQNPDESDFCGKCATSLGLDAAAGAPVGPAQGSFDKSMKDLGKEIEKGMADFGKAIEKEVEKKGKQVEDWYMKSFGLFGPFLAGLAGFVGVAVLLMVIAFFSMERVVWDGLRELVWDYALLLLALTIMGAYNKHLLRWHRDPHRWVWPLVVGAGALGWTWFFAKVLDIVGSGTGRGLIVDMSDFLSTFLIPIAILATIIAFIVAFGPERTSIPARQ